MRVEKYNKEQIIINNLVYKIDDIIFISTENNNLKFCLNSDKIGLSTETHSEYSQILFNKIAYTLNCMSPAFVKLEGDRIVNTDYFQTAEYFSEVNMLHLKGSFKLRITPISRDGARYIIDILNHKNENKNLEK